mmetsp:Transcript_46677/g.119116  ORF Transcript_46677/g.119116 Transcript_46677/m.119116 type:complete len:123 (-) Transcript_46677:389-757(-)|eukprot:jgi/Tetstr1/446496/TSEL_034024.t1
MADEPGKRKRDEPPGASDAARIKRAKEEALRPSGVGGPVTQPRRTGPVVVKTEQAKAAAQQQGKDKWEISERHKAEIQKGKKAALAQAEKATAYYLAFDSPFGNYLLPVLPKMPAASSTADS